MRTIGRQLAAVTQNQVSTPTRVRTRPAGGAKNGTGGGSDSADSIPLAAVPTLGVHQAMLRLAASSRVLAAAGSVGCRSAGQLALDPPAVMGAAAAVGSDAMPMPATTSTATINLVLFRTSQPSYASARGANDFLAATQLGGE